MATVHTLTPGNPASYQKYATPNNGAGQGWQTTYSTRADALNINADCFQIPQNAMTVSMTFLYNGAATVTITPQVSNGTREEVEAGTALWAPVPAAFGSVAGIGGTASMIAIPASVRFLRVVTGGSGSVGSDIVTVGISAVSRVDN